MDWTWRSTKLSLFKFYSFFFSEDEWFLNRYDENIRSLMGRNQNLRLSFGRFTIAYVYARESTELWLEWLGGRRKAIPAPVSSRCSSTGYSQMVQHMVGSAGSVFGCSPERCLRMFASWCAISSGSSSAHHKAFTVLLSLQKSGRGVFLGLYIFFRLLNLHS